MGWHISWFSGGRHQNDALSIVSDMWKKQRGGKGRLVFFLSVFFFFVLAGIQTSKIAQNVHRNLVIAKMRTYCRAGNDLMLL